mmetsp:Transcript_51707/g.92864  ORF Transcript_51707/g.92864 Transcript_51707/m.92864 type:complete len:92 (+) Transcript_51707:472-747(+)
MRTSCKHVECTSLGCGALGQIPAQETHLGGLCQQQCTTATKPGRRLFSFLEQIRIFSCKELAIALPRPHGLCHGSTPASKVLLIELASFEK